LERRGLRERAAHVHTELSGIRADIYAFIIIIIIITIIIIIIIAFSIIRRPRIVLLFITQWIILKIAQQEAICYADRLFPNIIR
jgi:hypothetical protein